MELLLRKPHASLKSTYLAGFAEMETDSDRAAWVCLGDSASRETPKLDFDAYVDTLLAKEVVAQPGFVKDTTYWAMVGDDMVGRISIRHELNDQLKKTGGHVGYIVRPSFRRRGFATEMLRKILETPKAREIRELLVTCNEDNVGSEKSILKCGGKFSGTIDLGNAVPRKKHFWITLSLICVSLLTAAGSSLAGSSAFNGTVNWMLNPMTGEDGLRGYAEFLPDESTPTCSDLRWIQVVRMLDNQGKPLVWKSGEQNRNALQTVADPVHGIEGNYFVDHEALDCAPGKPCSPYFRDSWPNADESADGSSEAANRKPASMVDYSYGWTDFASFRAETCVRCAESGVFYGCIRWGGDFPLVGNKTVQSPTYGATPSPTFLSALARFGQFYAPTFASFIDNPL